MRTKAKVTKEPSVTLINPTQEASSDVVPLSLSVNPVPSSSLLQEPLRIQSQLGTEGTQSQLGREGTQAQLGREGTQGQLGREDPGRKVRIQEQVGREGTQGQVGREGTQGQVVSRMSLGLRQPSRRSQSSSSSQSPSDLRDKRAIERKELRVPKRIEFLLRIPEIKFMLINKAPDEVIEFFIAQCIADNNPFPLPKYPNDQVATYISNFVDELEYHLGQVGPDDNVKKVTIENIRNFVFHEIQTHKICHVEEIIDEIRDKLLLAYRRSVITPGSTVGISAAMACSAQLMQMTLNSFHFVGMSKNATVGLERMAELIEGHMQKNRSMTIFFNNRYTIEEILRDKRKEFVGVTIDALVVSYTIIDGATIIRDTPWWYQVHRAMRTGRLPSQSVLRIILNRKKMYDTGITMRQVAERIEEEGRSVGVVCVYSPLNERTIDIHAYLKLVTLNKVTYDSADAGRMYLEIALKPMFSTIYLKSVEGITNVFPMELPIHSVFVKTLEHKDHWVVTLNNSTMDMYGIGIDRVKEVCELSGLKVKKIQREKVLIVKESPVAPMAIIAQKAEESRKNMDDSYRNYYCVYMETDGTNLREVLSKKDVNQRCTRSSDLNEIYELYGIEALRLFLIHEIKALLDAESLYIDPRNIVMLAEYMTVLGTYTTVGFAGLSKQNVTPMHLGSFERLLPSWSDKAIEGRSHPMDITTSVYVGALGKYGTGFMDILPDKVQSIPNVKGILKSSVPSITEDHAVLEDILKSAKRKVTFKDLKEKDPSSEEEYLSGLSESEDESISMKPIATKLSESISTALGGVDIKLSVGRPMTESQLEEVSQYYLVSHTDPFAPKVLSAPEALIALLS